MDGTILGKKYDIINGEGGGGKLTPATSDTLGGIKVGEGLEVTEDGTLSVDFPPEPEPYVLPTASAETLGGVKVGSGLSMDAETGILSNANMPLNYSTTEQNTGRKWIDGKDIYVKTIDCGALPNNTSKSVDSGLSHETIIKMEAFAYRTGNYYPLPFISVTTLSDCLKISYSSENHTIDLQTGGDKSSLSAYATLYYTKAEV